MAAAAKRPLAQRYPSVFSSSPQTRRERAKPLNFTAIAADDSSSSSAPRHLPLFRGQAPSPSTHSPNTRDPVQLHNPTPSGAVHRTHALAKSPAKLSAAATDYAPDPFGFFAAQRRLQSTRAESAIEIEARSVDPALTVQSSPHRAVLGVHDANRASSSPSKSSSPLKKRLHDAISEPDFDEAHASSTPRATTKKPKTKTAGSLHRSNKLIEQNGAENDSTSESSPVKHAVRRKHGTPAKHRTVTKPKPRAATRKAPKASVEPERSVDEEVRWILRSQSVVLLSDTLFCRIGRAREAHRVLQDGR